VVQLRVLYCSKIIFITRQKADDFKRQLGDFSPFFGNSILGPAGQSTLVSFAVSNALVHSEMKGSSCIENRQQKELFLFKKPVPDRFVDAIEKSKKKSREQKSEKRYFLCKFCKNRITSADHLIEISGSHQHACTNPDGDIFSIGCFSEASGCAATERWTTRFTWFAGFRWRVAVCSACFVQLGWEYHATDGRSFFGLILDRLLYDL
jgi:hypothetical protein